MLRPTIAVAALLLGATVADAQVGSGWLLWHYTYTIRAPKDVKPVDYERYLIQNDWVILNAVETRDQCRALLRDEFSQKRDWMAQQMVGPGGTVNQSPLGDGINASLWFGRDIKFGQASIDMRLVMTQRFWCLPASVDPRNVRIDLLEQK